MGNKNRRTDVILIVVVTVTLGFIWGHSCMGQEESSAESGFVFDLVRPFLEIFVGKGNVTEILVRKLAHFSEFLVLGIELTLLFRTAFRGWPEPGRFVTVWGIGTFCGLIDETIQIFSGRGPSVTDVWIDSAGVLTGVGIMTAVLWIFGKKKKKEE